MGAYIHNYGASLFCMGANYPDSAVSYYENADCACRQVQIYVPVAQLLIPQALVSCKSSV